MAHCPPEEIALKSFFLGPQSENGLWFREEVRLILEHYFKWRRNRFPEDGAAISELDKSSSLFRERQDIFHSKVQDLFSRLESETPKFTPRYIGHMVSEVSLPALLGHLVTLLHNPNHASYEVSKVTTEIEIEAIAKLAEMLGFAPSAIGHFTSGGTLANFEALYRAKARCYQNIALGLYLREVEKLDISLVAASQMSPEEFFEKVTTFQVPWPEIHIRDALQSNPFQVAKRIETVFQTEFHGVQILVPGHKHYSWTKGVKLQGLGAEAFCSVELDSDGRMSIPSLIQLLGEAEKNQRPVALVVSVAGTTELGEMDPLDKVADVLESQRRQGRFYWHHIDAAYGGFYRSMVAGGYERTILEPKVENSIRSIHRCDSLTIDPHKLGYVPYASGVFLARDSFRYDTTPVQAPYLKTEADKGRWAATLEGSRSGAGAVATWLTAECVGLDSKGYGKILEKGIIAQQKMVAALQTIPSVHIVDPRDTNVVCFSVGHPGESLSAANARTRKLYQTIYQGIEFSVSQTELGAKDYRLLIDRLVTKWQYKKDCDSLALVRLVLMNPFITSKEMKINCFEQFSRYLERTIQTL